MLMFICFLESILAGTTLPKHFYSLMHSNAHCSLMNHLILIESKLFFKQIYSNLMNWYSWYYDDYDGNEIIKYISKPLEAAVSLIISINSSKESRKRSPVVENSSKNSFTIFVFVKFLQIFEHCRDQIANFWLFH